MHGDPFENRFSPLKPGATGTRSKRVMPLPALILRPAGGPAEVAVPLAGPYTPPRGLAGLFDAIGLATAAFGKLDPSRAESDARAASGAVPLPADTADTAVPRAEATARSRAAADPDELDWIRRSRNGDEHAFRRLVERHGDRAYALALRIVRDQAEAEEVAQDAFLRAWRALPGFRGDAAFSTWLHRIVVRRALDRAQALRGRRGREADVEMDSIPDASAGRAPDLETVAKRRRLEALIAGLPAAQRAAITLFYFHDRSVLEVASVLGMPENTVKTHLSRARVALRDAWLGAEGEA